MDLEESLQLIGVMCMQDEELAQQNLRLFAENFELRERLRRASTFAVVSWVFGMAMLAVAVIRGLYM